MEILWGVHVVRQAQSYPPSTETEAATNHSLGLATTFGGAPYVAKVVLKKCFLWVIPQLTFYLTLYLDNLSDILSDVLSDIYSDSLSGILLSGLCSGPCVPSCIRSSRWASGTCFWHCRQARRASKGVKEEEESSKEGEEEKEAEEADELHLC